MSTYVLAFLIGVLAGLRSLTAPAIVSWGARLGSLHLENSWLASLGSPVASYLLGAGAIAELITDKLPKTPSRKEPAPFGFRIGMGALCGAALGAADQTMIGGLLAGAVGAVAGTLGGYELRRRLVKATGGKDFPIALLEDLIAICGGLWIVSRFA
jgi:uncharacterized membrane protein